MTEPEIAVVGIDLGTTYSCVARVDETGRPVVIPNAEGMYTTPSVVFFDGANRIVGQEAKNNAVLYPDQVVEMVKGQMGTDWRFPYADAEFTPEEISSYILRKVVSDAEQQLGHPVKNVVITCPAYFGIAEKEATKRAGEIAGLNVLSIINEPTAAAIAYGLLEGGDQVVLVYDLGGGTFDITMIDIKGGALTVIATGGDHHLGGRQWDEVMVNYLAEQWMAETGSTENPMDSPETLQDLFAKAEQGKWALSTPRGYTDIPVSHKGQRVGVRVTREKFDELTGHLLARTIQYTHEMLAQAAEKGYKRYDDILLVGGSTRMLQIKERIATEFKPDPKVFDPDQAVAKGAAVYAYKLSLDELFAKRFPNAAQPGTAPAMVGQAQEELAAELGISLPALKAFSALEITIVTSRSFGVVAWKRQDGGDVERVTNLIKANDPLPVDKGQMFGTYEANQPQAEIRFVEDLSHEDDVDPALCEEVGRAVMTLPSNLPAGSPIEITFRLNDQGLLHATAREVTRNRAVEVEIKTERAISAEEFSQAKARSGRLVVS